MKSEEIIENWKNQKSLIKPENRFTEKVMNQVCRYKQKKLRPLLAIMRWFSKLTFENPLVKFIFVASSVLLGLVRIAFVICMFLRT